MTATTRLHSLRTETTLRGGADFLPRRRFKEKKRHQHSRDEADGNPRVHVVTVPEQDDRPGHGDSYCPEHKKADKCREPHAPESVGEVDDAVQDTVTPVKRQLNVQAENGKVKSSRLLCEQARQRRRQRKKCAGDGDRDGPERSAGSSRHPGSAR